MIHAHRTIFVWSRKWSQTYRPLRCDTVAALYIKYTNRIPPHPSKSPHTGVGYPLQSIQTSFKRHSNEISTPSEPKNRYLKWAVSPTLSLKNGKFPPLYPPPPKPEICHTKLLILSHQTVTPFVTPIKKTHISAPPPHPITTAIQTPFKWHKNNDHEKPQKSLNQPSEPFKQRFPRTDTKKAVDANLQPQESNHAHHRAHFKPQKSNQNPTNANASFCRASSHKQA